MSVCVGSAMLAEYGLLDHPNPNITTHHEYLAKLQPALEFVDSDGSTENEKIITAGGLTSGIDVALQIVERYYGPEIARSTADDLEYHSDLWKQARTEDPKTKAEAR